MKVKKFNVSEVGLNHFFGPLEARIMGIIWSSDGISIKDVQGILSGENPISFNAVMTVMNRLLEKGHLKKFTEGSGRGRISCYQPVQSKEQFLMEQTQAVTFGLIQEYGDLVVNHMIDALEGANPEMIAKLQMKLNEVKSRERP
ncbi:MAG TPA: BlaI/MecI/CopY family transcriptional regulator [Bacilli bacterium]